jgi:hypothetical protein
VLAECATNHLPKPQIVGQGVSAYRRIQFSGQVNEQGNASGRGGRAMESELTGQIATPLVTGPTVSRHPWGSARELYHCGMKGAKPLAPRGGLLPRERLTTPGLGVLPVGLPARCIEHEGC